MASVSFQGVMKRLMVLGLVLGALANVPHANAITARELVEVIDFSSPVVSPAGDKVAFRTELASIERNTYDTVWYVQSMNGESPPQRVADGGIPLRDSAGVSLPATAVWSPDGRWIYYRALVDGKIDIWRAATDGSGARPITLDPADIRDFALDQSGKVLKYSVGPTREEVAAAEQGEYDRGIRMDETVPIGQGLFRSGKTGDRLATQRYDTAWFDRTSLLGAVPDHWKEVDLATGAIRNPSSSAAPADPNETAGLGAYPTDVWRMSRSPHNGRVAMLTRVGEQGGLRQKPDVQLSVMGATGDGSGRICMAALCSRKPITGIQWRSGSDEVLFTVTDPNAGLAQSIFRWNVELDVVHPVVEAGGLIDGGRDTSSNCGISSTALACVTAEANQPPRLERIDLKTGKRKILFEPNAALAHGWGNSRRALPLRWKAADGRVFTGQFYPARGVGGARSPLFVSYYRCAGFVRGGLGDEWPFAVLAEHGISALCINAAPSVSDAIVRYGNALPAVESAIQILSAEAEVDRSRVGMGGLSFGSEVAMWVAMNSSLLSAVSISSTSVSPNYYLLASLKGEAFFGTLQDIWGLGAPGDTPERWRALSPAFNLDRINAPILFQMPEQEYMQALDYAIPLLRANRADMYVFPNEPHQKFQPRHKLAVYERNLDWFRYWLMGVEDPDPAKTQQYVHWRAMRSSATKGDQLKGTEEIKRSLQEGN